MKKLFVNMLILMFVAGLQASIAQTKGPQASFAKEVHDFGKINEADGPVTYKFEFTNVGAAPLIISNVSASCGCTTPNYPKEPILPGAKNSITVSYNPANRPGRFDKTITVFANTEPANIILRITGDVIPKQPSLEDMYPNDIQGLRLKSSQIAMNNIAPNAVSTQNLEVYNSTDGPLKVGFKNIPKHIKIKITPETIAPKAKAMIEVVYDAKAKADWGFVFDAVELAINDKTNSNSRITITANIQEDFSKLTEDQKKNAPKIEFENATFDFGKVKQGEKIKFEYVYANKGNSDLVIRKVSPSCGCTAVANKNSVVKPGEKGVITSEFNTAGRTGSQSKTITIITNDPANPRVILWIKGTIE